MDELLEQFLIEGRELAQQAAEDLLALERDPADADRIDGAFRAVHTLKGSVGLFDFAPMAAALHMAEDLLGAVRAGDRGADRFIIDALLDCIGAVEGWIDSIAVTQTLPAGAEAQSRRLREAFAAAGSGEETPAAASATAVPELDWLPGLLARDEESVAAFRRTGRPLTALRYVPLPDCFFLGDDPLALVRAVPDLLVLTLGAREPWQAEDLQSFTCNLVIELLSGAPPDEVRRIFRQVSDQIVIVEPEPPAEANPALVEAGTDATARSFRVDAARIDAMADIVGELIVAKNALAHLAARAASLDPQFARALAVRQGDIERLVGDMHSAVMNVRLIPLSRLFRRFARVVRDIAGRLGKEIAFEIHGEEVEADKSIVDGLSEPVLHLLRNAVDHGIEDAATRKAAGKPPEGRVRLSARQEHDQIVIVVTDDGAGMDPARVRAVAASRGLMPAALLDEMNDRLVLDLIFTPGFSTASAVTDISGRGVGLDAVRTGVAALGGRVVVDSAPGRGSAFRMNLPQTVSVTAIMTVLAGDEMFGVPIQSVAETARIPRARIVPIRNGMAFVLRNRTIPLIRLSSLLHLPPAGRTGADVKVLIVHSGDHPVGIEVDGFAERIEVLMRPLTGLLSGMPGILGTALHGDGRVLMVLNLPELIG